MIEYCEGFQPENTSEPVGNEALNTSLTLSLKRCHYYSPNFKMWAVN